MISSTNPTADNTSPFEFLEKPYMAKIILPQQESPANIASIVLTHLKL